MGRPPCCDKDGIKKGPWTPEEDIILVSYIQQHGPGNWRSVPTNTGLLRCSKSCRLRWTNYLRPGIKRGNFTPHEEGMIIHLQALLGNKWAAIASYLPQRTDNDIKNYWNTHLKKKLKRFESGFQQQEAQITTLASASTPNPTNDNDQHAATSLAQVNSLKRSASSSSSSACYASSTENISRLLENWMKDSNPNKQTTHHKDTSNNSQANMAISEEEEDEEEDDNKFDSILSFGNSLSNNVVATATGTTATSGFTEEDESNPPLTFLEKWLLDETTPSRQVVDDILQLPPIF